MFNIARVPQRACDVLSFAPEDSEHRGCIVVTVHDWFYRVSVCEDASSQYLHRHPYFLPLATPQQLEARLLAVVADAGARLESGERAVPVGILTADERDMWADVSLLVLFVLVTFSSLFCSIQVF